MTMGRCLMTNTDRPFSPRTLPSPSHDSFSCHALAVAYAIQEPYCIDSYASACTDSGISPEEMAEAVNVAAVIRGGGTIAHWVQACNTASRKEV